MALDGTGFIIVLHSLFFFLRNQTMKYGFISLHSTLPFSINTNIVLDIVYKFGGEGSF